MPVVLVIITNVLLDNKTLKQRTQEHKITRKMLWCFNVFLV